MNENSTNWTKRTVFLKDVHVRALNDLASRLELGASGVIRRAIADLDERTKTPTRRRIYTVENCPAK